MGGRPQKDDEPEMQNRHLTQKIEEVIHNSCRAYFKKNRSDVSFPESVEVDLQLAKDSSHGDLTSNIAMRLAKMAAASPSDLASGIALTATELIRKTKIADVVGKIENKSGFLNVWLSDGYYRGLLADIRRSGVFFGSNKDGKGEKVNLEYVSANPTGPLTIAHGRQAAIGDTLSRILRFNGYSVTNEYYLNDYGRQINLLGKSLEIRYLNLLGHNDPMPEDGYMGGYITDMARDILKNRGKSLADRTKKEELFFRKYAVDHIMKLILKDLKDFGVKFDTWTSQAKIEDNKEVQKVLGLLRKRGYIYDDDGATWFASTKFGDDKDRVVIKNDGSYTYLAPDIAYHSDKYRRGYDRLVDLLGPDHHGYIRRMKAAVQALGKDQKSLEILIVQLVTLLRKGETVSMSTRKGEFISLREIIDEIGKDVARFFFLSRRLDSHLDFDIELAKQESAENPVYYIQYAHARICSIKKYSRKNFLKLFFVKTRPELLTKKEERDLIRKLGEFPFAVKSAAQSLEPNRVVAYLNDLARLFHSFYTECRVVSDDHTLSKTRLYLVDRVRSVLANGLRLLNISLPEKM